MTSAVLMLVYPARADDRYWRNSAGGTFSNAGNWNGGSPVPGPNDIVHFGLRSSIFEEPAYAVSFTANATNQSLVVEDDSVIFSLNGHTYTCSENFGSVVGYVSGRTGRLSIINGHMDLGVMTVGGTGPGSVTLSNGGTVQTDYFWRIGSGSSGGVGVSGTNCEWIHNGELSVGYGGTGALTISNGGQVENGTGLIADGANPGTVTISDAASRWLNLNDLIVGNGGAATLNINGGRVDCDSGHVSFVAGHTGVVNVSGDDAEWVIGEQVFIGDIASGTMDITNGGLVTSPVAAIGAAPGSSGVVTVSGDPDPGGVSEWFNSGDMNVGHSGAGTLNILDGGEVQNGNSFIGRFAGSTGQVTVDEPGSFWLNTGSLRVGGSTAAPGGRGRLDILDGAVTVTGQLKIWDTTDTVVNLSGGTLNILSLDTSGNPSRFNWTGGTLDVINLLSVDASGPLGPTLALAAPQTLRSSSLVGINSGGQFTVAGGTVDIPHLNVNGTFDMTAGSVTTGALTAGNLGSPNSGAGTGTIFLSGGTLTTGPVYLGSSVGGTGHVTVSGTGTLECNKLSANDLIVDGGTVIVEDPGPPIGEDPALYRSAAAGYFRNGAIAVNAGTLTAPNVKLGIEAGMTGTYTQTGGALNVDVFGVGNDGTLTGGAGTGYATISGGSVHADSYLVGSTAGGTGRFHWSAATLTGQSLMMTGDAELGVALAGTVPGSGYSRLQLTASAVLTGTLAITRTGGFEPGLGDSFVVIACDSLTGAFEHVTGMAAGPGKVFRVQYNPNDLTLIVEAADPGDCDSDGDIDMADYLEFQDCLSGSNGGGSGCACADLDGDGDADLADFAEFQVMFTE